MDEGSNQPSNRATGVEILLVLRRGLDLRKESLTDGYIGIETTPSPVFQQILHVFLNQEISNSPM
jgi:hypothetical protein